MKHPDINNCSTCNLCFVRKDSVFSVLTQDEIDIVEAAKSIIVFNDNELIFKERQHSFGIYIIVEGKVKISKYGFEGKEYIVRFATRGNIIGYRSFLGGECYSCSATAISKTELCFLPGEVILKLIRKNPELGLQFMKYLAKDLRGAEDKAISIAQKHVRERVAEAILILKDIYGYEQDNTINARLKRDEIASIAGTSRETVIRLLSEYNEEKILLIQGRKISILDLESLIQHSNRSF